MVEQYPDVESAKGKAVIDHGVRTIYLTVTAGRCERFVVVVPAGFEPATFRV